MTKTKNKEPETVCFGSTMKFIVAILILMGAIAAWASWSISQRARKLSQVGLESTAVITAKRTTGKTSSQARPTYDVFYEFEFDGKKYTNELSTSRMNYDSFQVGEKTPVTFLPDDPNFNEIINGNKSFAAWAALFVSILMFGCAIALFRFQTAQPPTTQSYFAVPNIETDDSSSAQARRPGLHP